MVFATPFAKIKYPCFIGCNKRHAKCINKGSATCCLIAVGQVTKVEWTFELLTYIWKIKLGYFFVFFDDETGFVTSREGCNS